MLRRLQYWTPPLYLMKNILYRVYQGKMNKVNWLTEWSTEVRFLIYIILHYLVFFETFKNGLHTCLVSERDLTL